MMGEAILLDLDFTSNQLSIKLSHTAVHIAVSDYYNFLHNTCFIKKDLRANLLYPVCIARLTTRVEIELLSCAVYLLRMFVK